jgi:hypothetical protein
MRHSGGAETTEKEEAPIATAHGGVGAVGVAICPKAWDKNLEEP